MTYYAPLNQDKLLCRKLGLVRMRTTMLVFKKLGFLVLVRPDFSGSCGSMQYLLEDGVWYVSLVIPLRKKIVRLGILT